MPLRECGQNSGEKQQIFWLLSISGVPWRLIGLAGKNDNRDLSGTARGWGSASPGLPIRTIVDEEVANPIILLDEIDKCGGSDHNGRVQETLISLLERGSASVFMDDFLQARTNLSWISWLATANSVARLSAPLLSRFQVVEVKGPAQPHEFLKIIEITKREVANRYGITPEFMPSLGPDELKVLRPYMKNPRRLAKATENLLSVLMTKPADGRLH